MAESKLCLTAKEAALQLNISISKLYQLLRDGDIPSFHVGRKILIPTHELEQWLHTQATCDRNLKT